MKTEEIMIRFKQPCKIKNKDKKIIYFKGLLFIGQKLQVVPTSKSVIGCCFQSIFMQLVVKVWRHVWRGSDNDENEAGRSLKKRSWGNGSVYYSSVRVNIVILLENTRVKLQDITLASCHVRK